MIYKTECEATYVIFASCSRYSYLSHI